MSARELAQLNMDKFFDADIRNFKTRYCDELKHIISALRRDFRGFASDPILDVGAGPEAVSIGAFPGRDITLLDTLEYPPSDQNEKRIKVDFFEYVPLPSQKPHTLLFCHVLQYLDGDPNKLNRQISLLGPDKIISVTNKNDGPFGEAVRWGKKHFPSANPESDISMEPYGYRLIKKTDISATLRCPDFSTLAYQFGRLILDLSVTASRSPALKAYLESALNKPTFVINQAIKGYEKI